MNNNTQPTIDLLKGAIGKSLSKVVHDLGCPDLPNVLLTAEHHKYLQSQVGDLPADEQIRNLLLSGKVVQVGHAPEGENLFTVRIHLHRLACHITLSYYHNDWEVYSIDSVRSPKREWSRLLVGAVAGAVVAAAVAFIIGGTHSTDAVAEAKKQGYVVLTEAEYQQQVHSPVTSKATPAGSNDQAAGNNGQTAGNATTDGQSITFTMKDGMSPSDLSSFLKDQGLIPDQAQFDHDLTVKGIDTLIRPGDYVFKKGMTEDQIFSVLQGQS